MLLSRLSKNSLTSAVPVRSSPALAGFLSSLALEFCRQTADVSGFHYAGPRRLNRMYDVKYQSEAENITSCMYK